MTANACLICNLWHLTMPCDDEGSSSSAFLWPKQGGCLFVLQVVTLQMRLVPEESQCGHHSSAGAQLQGAANEACIRHRNAQWGTSVTDDLFASTRYG